MQDLREETLLLVGGEHGDMAGVLGTLGEEWWRQTLARKGVD